MAQEKLFTIQLKNDQTFQLKFTSIPATHDQLWQMFATTESLEMLQQLINVDSTKVTSSARKTAPAKSTIATKKKNK